MALNPKLKALRKNHCEYFTQKEGAGVFHESKKLEEALACKDERKPSFYLKNDDGDATRKAMKCNPPSIDIATFK